MSVGIFTGFLQYLPKKIYGYLSPKFGGEKKIVKILRLKKNPTAIKKIFFCGSKGTWIYV